MRRQLWSVCLVLFAVYAARAMVDVSEIGVGARPLSLGRAFAGGLDDATAIFSNPAALALNSQLNILSMSGTILQDINYIVAGVSESSPFGKLAIGYVNAGVVAIPLTAITGGGSTAAVVQTGATNYSSSIVFLSYGSRLSRFLRGSKGDNVAVGASLKLFQQGFTGGGTAMQDASGNGADLDFSLLWEAYQWATFGLTLKNCLPERYGGRFQWDGSSVEEGIAMSSRIGGKFSLLGENALKPHEEQSLALFLDGENGGGTNRPIVWHAGLEYWPLDLAALRVGLDQRPKATEAGVSVDNNLTAGLGLKYLGFTFDYAYHQFGDLAGNTTHFFSFGYRGRDDLSKSYEQSRGGKKGFIPLAEVVNKPELVTFKDLQENYWARRPIEYLASLGIIGGYADQTFKPEQPLSRGELAVILVKAKDFDLPKIKEAPFADVLSGNWLAPYIKVAVSRHYMDGFPGGTFNPNQAVSRAEAAISFSRYAGLYVKPKVQSRVYSDVPADYWAAPAIAAAKQAGLFEYLAGQDFEPNKAVSRAEAAEIMSKTPNVKIKIKKLILGE